MSPDTKDIFKLIFEKFILAIAVAAVSAVLLYNYNLYSKAVELAQAQSHGYSALALMQRNLVLDASIKLRQNLRTTYNKGARVVSSELLDQFDQLSIEIEGVSLLLVGQTKAASATAQKILRLWKDAGVKFASRENFNRIQIEKFEKDLTDLQVEFIENHNREIGDLTLAEYTHYISQFENAIPWPLQPGNFLIETLGVFIASSVLILFLMKL